MKNTHKKSDSEILRQKAEDLLKLKSSGTPSSLSEIETLKLMHELEVHQVELELQNNELRQAWAEAEVANDKYIGLYDFAPSGYFTLSGKGVIIELNLSGAKMLGKDRQHLKNSLFVFFVSEETKSIFRLFLERTFKSKAKESCEVTMDGAGSLPFHVFLTGAVSENGEQCFVSAFDITERKRLESIIKTRNLILELSNHCSLDELLIKTLDEVEILSKSKISFLHFVEDDQETLSLQVWSTNTLQKMCSADGKGQHYPIDQAGVWVDCIAARSPVIHNDYLSLPHRKGLPAGHAPVIREMVVPIFRNEKIVAILGVGNKEGNYDQTDVQSISEIADIIWDIAERKKGEKELSQSRERYQKDLILLNSILESPVNIIIFSLDKNYSYTAFTTFHREIMKKIWGVEISTGMNMLDIISNSEDRQKAKNNFDRALKGEHFVLSEDFGDELLYRTYYDNYYSPVKEGDGNITGVSVFVIDITERKQAEVSIKEALEKAEASNLLKTAFMNNISHEVRTPLNGIMGFGSLLTDPNLTTEERQQYNQLLKASGNRLINTITDYMDISLVASGNIEVSRKPVNVPDLLKELQTKFRDSCDVKNLVLNLTIPAEQEHFTLITDLELLRKIISCLLDNAIKFTSLGSINFGYAVKPGTIDFFVIDTGIGIAPEFHEHIFEPFMQEIITDTRGHEGSGLGLSIIKGFLKLLGSEIRLESAKGQGASFFFSLPIETGTTNENDAIAPPLRHVEIIRPVVLVAEDDISSDIYIEIILKSIASVVLKAANGKEAVEMCHLHPEISLVLMDLKMPVMDGLEATRQIKSFRKELPIIALTAYAFSKDKKKTLETGCDEFLSKPVSKHDLLEKFKKFGFL